MSKPSKFSGALAKLKQPAPETPTEALLEPVKPAPPSVSGGATKIGRPIGKRSNPDYEPTTVLLRKATKKKAQRRLQDTDAGQDLSDLIEALLSEWMKA